ncbi:jg20087 [Pararge aegeria aegeria]|uniref:Jg20087 protein n=1 Tax=Pararge aegeria aegeria TaxID=348720 RepID=A0A8S4S3Q4_9NEOP|nr:jg20087 [Pararge aegeria aegeria]
MESKMIAGQPVRGTGENGSWKGTPDCCGADQRRRYEALCTRPRYINHVGILTVPRGSIYQPRRDPYGASRFDGSRAKELYSLEPLHPDDEPDDPDEPDELDDTALTAVFAILESRANFAYSIHRHIPSTSESSV